MVVEKIESAFDAAYAVKDWLVHLYAKAYRNTPLGKGTANELQEKIDNHILLENK